MKRISLTRRYILMLCLMLHVLTACKKHHTDANGLPPATQIGANSLGFSLNGQPWTPQGNNGTANLSIDYDPGVNNGVVGVSAYRIISNTDREYFSIGVSDSLNHYSAPFSLNLTRSGLYRIYFSRGSCTFFSDDSSTSVNGNLTLTKLDRTNHIVAGVFNATLFKQGCDTVKITNGRFDMKY